MADVNKQEGVNQKISEKRFLTRVRLLFNRNVNLISASFLVLLGIVLLLNAILNDPNHKEFKDYFFAFQEKLGLTLLVAGLTAFILIFYRRQILKIFNDKTSEIDQSIELKEKERNFIQEIEGLGIKSIYKDRGTSDKVYRKDLIRYLNQVPDNQEVKIIGVTLARFFGPDYDKEILSLFLEMIDRGITFKLLVIDPRSKAAIKRAETDQKEWLDKHGYVSCTIFKDLLTVLRKVKEPTADWCINESIRQKIKDSISLRLYNTNPVCHLIILSTYVFVEQYHNGGGEYIRKKLLEYKQYSNLPNYTGFVPVLRVKKHSLYGELMNSHFDNLWNEEFSIKNDIRIDSVYESIFDYAVREWEKRGVIIDNKMEEE